MKSQLEDFNIFESNIPILCDNTSTICLGKNPILHSRAKHIKIKHHFIRDYIQKGILNLKFIDTAHQWADIFTKPLSEDRFNFIRIILAWSFVQNKTVLILYINLQNYVYFSVNFWSILVQNF